MTRSGRLASRSAWTWPTALGLVALLGSFVAAQGPMPPASIARESPAAAAPAAATTASPSAASPGDTFAGAAGASGDAGQAESNGAADAAGGNPTLPTDGVAGSPNAGLLAAGLAGAAGPIGPAVKSPAPPAIGSKSMLQVFRDGGPLMYPIVGCSFLLVVFFFERLISLRRGRVIPRPFSRKFIEQLQDGLLDRESALDLCEENPSPVSDVFAAAIKKWGRPAVEVEQAILDTGERVTNDLRRNIRLFNAISTVSPLLGLLGTVFGMISCFQNISSADAMGRPEMLAGGIGEALLTTAGGLAVAIPALVAYWFFVSRVDSLVVEIDGLGQRIVEVIAAEAKLDAARLRAARRERRAAASAAETSTGVSDGGKRSAEKGHEKGHEKGAERNAEKSGEKSGEKGAEKAGERAADRASERSGDKAGERSRDRAA